MPRLVYSAAARRDVADIAAYIEQQSTSRVVAENAIIYQKQRDVRYACAHWRRARDIWQQIGNAGEVAEHDGWMRKAGCPERCRMLKGLSSLSWPGFVPAIHGRIEILAWMARSSQAMTPEFAANVS